MTVPTASRLAAAAGLLALTLALALPAFAAGPYPTTLCAGTRTGTLGCSANDVAIAQVVVTNGVTQCVAGTTVNLGLSVQLRSNANSRYDVGVFVARDGKPPEISIGEGGSALCAVFGIPTSPPPLADFDGNACGDIEKSNSVATVDLGTVSVLCLPDQNGRLKLPATVTWQQNAGATCQAPPAAWVEAGTSSKCNASAGLDVPVQVVGSLTIVKRTLPAAPPGAFAFVATGASPTAFSLSDGQQQAITTGPLGATPSSVTVTESLLAGFDPSAEIACTTVDGGQAIATIDAANRRVTVPFDRAQSRVTCTFTNKAASAIRVVKNTVGGDDAFPFIVAQQDVTVTTTGGTGQQLIGNLSAGRHSVTEVVPAGWTLTNIACTDPTGGTTTSLPGKSATVDLAVGETVTCTFTNTKVAPATGTINIVKTTTGGNASFPFSTAGVGLTAFSLATSGGLSPTKSFTGLAAGAYTVTESVPPGWALTSITCVDPTGNSTGAGSTATINLAAGETVTCTFANRADASVVIEKVTQGGDGTFNFTGTAGFSITTVGGFGQDATTFASVTPGVSFSYAETVPAGWEFAATTCRDAVTNASVGVPIANGRTFVPGAGQRVICTVNNRRLAQFKVVEVSLPKAAQPFAYTVAGTGLANFTLFDDGTGANTRVFTDVAAGGAYSVAQAAVPGWSTPLILCSDRLAANPGDRTTVDLANRTVTPSLQPGEQLTCLFVNAQVAAGSIGITKLADGGDDTFAFANSGGIAASPTNPSNFPIATVSGAGSRNLTALLPGTYTITEGVPAGWLSPPTVQCSVVSGSNTTITPVANGVTVNLGQTGLDVDSVACTFANTKAARLTIVEDAVPNAAQSFAFAAQGTGIPASFSLVNDGTPAPADRVSFAGLAPGAVRVVSTTPAGWRLASVSCTGTGSAVTSLATGQLDLTLLAGDDVACTFQHQQQGTLTVTKSAPAVAAGDTFAFQGPSTIAGDYADGETRTVSVTPGTYAVTEVVPDGWTLSNIACAGGTTTLTGAAVGPTNGFEPGDTTANVTLAAGQAASCTFTNTPSSATIVVRKISVGGAGVFAFTGVQDFQIDTRLRTLPEYAITVPAGTHVVREVVPEGWQLTGLACTGTSTTNLATATATVAIAAGERVRCTFTDEKLGRIVVTKAIRGEATSTFAFSAPAALVPAQVFTLAPTIANGSDSRVFENVPTGDYLITESGPVNGFRLVSIACNDPTGNSSTSPADGGAFIRLAPGETVSCTWTNATTGTIVVSAVSFLGQDQFRFNLTNFPTVSSLAIATTPFVTDVSLGRSPQQNLAPATYTITPQLPPAGWTFQYQQCVSSSGEQHWSFSGASTSIALPDGETVRCYYFYAPSATAVLDPITVPTLSPFMLALLAFCIAAIAWKRRSRMA